MEPGLIGGEVNKLLANFHKKSKTSTQYKIGPDPSSIDSCMIGGIVSNNSSGMCCGVSQNTYHTLKDMRIVFADGTILDTADPESRDAFLISHADLVKSAPPRVYHDNYILNTAVSFYELGMNHILRPQQVSKYSHHIISAP